MIGSANEDKKALWKKLEKLNTKIEKNDIIIIINPDGGELPLREWPLENYIMLAKELLKDSRIFIIITGLKTARKHADAIIRSVKNDRIIDLTDKTTLKDLFTLYNISHIHVTCDSGPAHFASLTQIKNIIFFGPETPHLYSPLGENNIIFYSNYACSPCITAYNHRNSACKDSKCLKAISYEQVYKIISKEIEKIKKSKDNNA
jgi:ADP-heptose:LPS heptosyltransferase